MNERTRERGPNRRAARRRASGFLRYVALDIAGHVGGLLGGLLAARSGGGTEALIAGVIVGENLTFYASAAAREWARVETAGARTRAVLVARRLRSEFAFAEVLDWLLWRPMALALASAAVDSPAAGIAIGSFVADLAFYSVAWLTASRSANGSRAVTFLAPAVRAGASEPYTARLLDAELPCASNSPPSKAVFSGVTSVSSLMSSSKTARSSPPTVRTRAASAAA